MRSTRALGRVTLEHARTGGPDISAGAAGFLTLLRAGFAEPTGSPRPLVVSCTTVSPLPAPTEVDAGGLFSVALSRGSPRVGVAHRPALRSPDLPRPPRSPEGNAVARPAPPHGQRSGDSGFEARRWRSSHLNHRPWRLVAGAPRTSTTDRGGSSLALLAPQPPRCANAGPIPPRGRDRPGVVWWCRLSRGPSAEVQRGVVDDERRLQRGVLHAREADRHRLTGEGRHVE